jgi:hypothetical protein
MRSQFGLGFAVLTGLVLALPGPSAFATTVVTGNVDTNAPLVLDPTGTPNDAETIDVDFGTVVNLSFIQRMPVTKVISQVTMGDLGSAGSCSVPVSARLYVYEHVNGDLAGGTEIAYSEDNRDLPATPAKVSWTIPPTTLRQGRGYSFKVAGQGDSCRDGRLTTWGHNETGVDGGSVRCTGGPPATPGGNPVMRRMWHAAGANDRDPNCVSYLNDWAFHPTMPEGWLVTDNAGWYALSGTSPTKPSAESLCTTPAAQAGAKVVFWREYPYVENTKEWLCVWPQYAPLDQATTHGWYYALPWRNDNTGTPRDVYLKLDTIDYDAVLQDHLPIYLYDSGENFFVLSPGSQTDYYDLYHEHYSSALQYSDPIYEYLNMAVADPDWAAEEPTLDRLALSYLGPSYPSGESPRSGTGAATTDRISAPVYPYECEHGVEYLCADYQANTMALQQGYANQVYGHIAHDEDGKLWLQYWVFFYYNPNPAPIGGGAHEGDWEMVQIGLDGSFNPDTAVYAYHTKAARCDWVFTEHSGTHPVVYVAQWSHASYFGDDRIPSPENVYDSADGNGGGFAPTEVNEITSDAPAWAAWPGHWGSNGPEGPKLHEQWASPSAWADSADSCPGIP